MVYVDSGSTDGSVATARSLGAEVVQLDLRIPFTAARARNAGLAKLRTVAPNVEFVQFVDGDCEVRDGWLATARRRANADDRDWPSSADVVANAVPMLRSTIGFAIWNGTRRSAKRRLAAAMR